MRRKKDIKKPILILTGIIAFIVLICTIIYHPINDYFSPFSYQQGNINEIVITNSAISIINADSITWNPSTKKLNYLNNEPDYFGSHEQLFIDNYGHIWSPSDGWGLYMIENKLIHHWWTGENRTYSDAIRGMAFSKNNLFSIHAGSDTGIMGYFDISSMKWEYPWKENGSIKGKPYSYQIAVDRQNNLYIASDEGYLNIYKDGKWIYEKMPCRGRFPLPLYVDNDDNIWVYCDAVPSGISFQQVEWLAKYSNGNWMTFDIYGSTKIHDYPSTIEIDAENRIWIVFTYGTLILENDKLKQISSDKFPFAGEDIADITIDNLQRYWFITKSYLGVYNGLEWQILTSKEFGFEKWSLGIGDNDLAIDKDGNLWIGTLNDIIKFNVGESLKPGNGEIDILLNAAILNIVNK
jgi:ligand-binding sensor domain-containing protein